MKKITSYFTIILFFILSIGKAQNLISIQPNSTNGKDAVVSDLQPNSNRGSYEDFISIAWTNGGTPVVLRSLIEFDLSSIPNNSIIDSAFLNLYALNSPRNGSHSKASGSNESVLQRVTQSWSENSVSWNNQPTVDTSGQIFFKASDSSSQDYRVNVTGLVDTMYNNQSDNYGFIFKLTNEAHFRSLVFASSDYTNSSLRPKLEVYYSSDSLNHFVTSCRTNNNGFTGDSSIYINIDESLNYNFDIDWDNDGVFDSLEVTTDIIHKYNDTGTYTIRISGDFPRILFGEKDEKKLISINQWGSNKWTTMERAFQDCSNLKYFANDDPLLVNATSLNQMFDGASKFNGDITNWDVSSIVEMDEVFNECVSFNQDLGNWDVSKVTSFKGMFSNCILFNQDIGGWNMSSAIDLSGMFKGSFQNKCIFNQDISGWDVSAVIDFSDMFSHNDSFNVAIGGWDVSSAEDMSNLFYYAGAFNQAINNWNVSAVTAMDGMFNYASAFNQPLDKWDVLGVISMSNLFSDAILFDQNLADWDIDSVETMRDMFSFSGMSIESYDSTLIGWEGKNYKSNVNFYPSNMEYCHADSARAQLIADGWVFANRDSKNCQITGLNSSTRETLPMNLSPNPSKYYFTLSVDDKKAKKSQLLKVYSLEGTLVISRQITQAKTQISIDHLPKGIYAVHYGNETQKLVIH